MAGRYFSLGLVVMHVGFVLFFFFIYFVNIMDEIAAAQFCWSSGAIH